MKIVVTGSLGNVGKPLTEILIKDGHQVTVISSKEDKKKDIEALGAKSAVGSVLDSGFLIDAFKGSEAVFVMIPPNFSAQDMRAYYNQLGNNYVQAIEQNGIKRAVHLSSWGADLSEGTGFILGSHDVEGILDKMQGVSVTHLRAASFYYNIFGFTDMLKHTGIIGANYGGSDSVAWVHPKDIAAAAAEELEKPVGEKVRYVVSDETTADEMAQALGAAIGKPDLKWTTFTNDQMKDGLEKNGLPPYIIFGMVDIGASIHDGRLGSDYEKSKPIKMGKIKANDFAKEFATVYNK